MFRKVALIWIVFCVSSLYAGGFDDFYKKFGELQVNQGYHKTNKEMKKRAKRFGYYATTKEVKDALDGKKIDKKPVIVVDSRTKKEQAGLKLKGAVYANLRGWNKAFEPKKMHSDNIGAVYNYCRTGTDVAGNIINLEWLFQGKAKIFGLKDMVQSCYPTISENGNVLDAKLNIKSVYVQQSKDGFYYEVNCKEVKNSCLAVDIFTKDDIELMLDDDEKLPDTFVVTNKKLNKNTTLYLGKDNRYYKKGCLKN